MECTLINSSWIDRPRGSATLCKVREYGKRGVKFHVHSGTSEREKKAPFWMPVEAGKVGLKLVQPQMFSLKAFSEYLCKT